MDNFRILTSITSSLNIENKRTRDKQKIRIGFQRKEENITIRMKTSRVRTLRQRKDRTIALSRSIDLYINY